MKNLKYTAVLSVLLLFIGINVNAQVKTRTFKLDTALLKNQLKINTKTNPVNYNLAATAPNAVAATANIKSFNVKVKDSSPNFKYASPAIVQPNSIHVTPLPTTTFKPVLITSPGGTRSTIGTDGTFKKVN